MNLYATGTTVAPEKSRAEIERILTRYGATGFAYGWDGPRAVIAFRAKERNVKFVLPLPKPEDFKTTPTGRQRRNTGRQAIVAEMETRRRWRALALAVKSKLEMVASGIVQFDDEFLPYIVMPDGRTVAEHVRPGIVAAYAGKPMKALLPSFG